MYIPHDQKTEESDPTMIEKNEKHKYHDLQNDEIIYKTYFYDGFIPMVSFFLILIILVQILGIFLGTIEYHLNYIELILFLIQLTIIISLLILPCIVLTIILGPSLIVLRTKIGTMNVSRCNIILSKDYLTLNFKCPILIYPMINPYSSFFKEKEISNKIPISIINNILPLVETNDEHQKYLLKKIRRIKFYKKPGIMHLSGVDRADIFRLELVKEIYVYNYNLHYSYFFSPKPIKTKYIYFTIDKKQISNFLYDYAQYKGGIDNGFYTT